MAILSLTLIEMVDFAYYGNSELNILLEPFLSFKFRATPRFINTIRKILVKYATFNLKCYSKILCGGSAENFRFWLFCTELVAN